MKSVQCGHIPESLVKISNNEQKSSYSNHIRIQIISVHHCHAITRRVVVLEVIVAVRSVSN